MKKIPLKKLSLVSLFLASLSFFPSAWAVSYTVNSTDDVSDVNGCTSTHCSLREAIVAVNSSCTGSDEIRFNIASSNASSGPPLNIAYYSIKPTTPYPPIRCKVTIDGYTQPGAVAGSPLVELSGELMAATLAPSPVDPVLKVSLSYPAGLVLLGRDGLGNVLTPNPSGSTIKGLMINKFPRLAIYVYGADNNTIVGNYIGLDVTGEKAGFANARVELVDATQTNGDDLRIEASSNNFIGTTSVDYAQNVINVANRNFFGSSGRSPLDMVELNENSNGLALCNLTLCKREDIGSNNNVVQGNFMGLNKAGKRSIGGFRLNGTAGDPSIDPSAKYSMRNAGIFIGGPLPKTSLSASNLAVANAQNRSNVIGGLGANQGNVIVATRSSTIVNRGPLTSVLGNIIGLDATGTSITNIAGSAPSATLSGIAMSNAAWGALIEGNIVGQSGRGDTAAVTFNPGININTFFNLPGPYDVVIRRNIIGTDRTGTLNAGNAGGGIAITGDICQTRVDAGNACFLRVESNVIANNGIFANTAGVILQTTIVPAGFPIAGFPAGTLFTPRNVSILSNSIYANMGLGIDLNATFSLNILGPQSTFFGDGVTLNDSKGHDNPTGLPNPTPNHLQNFPVLNAAKSFINPEKAKVYGSLDSKPNQQYLIQIFANAVGDASGNGEGQVFVGEKVVTTDGAGHVDFKIEADKHAPVLKDPNTGVCTAAPVLTATATDVLTGDTSEFSQWVTVDVKGSANAYSKRCDKENEKHADDDDDANEHARDNAHD